MSLEIFISYSSSAPLMTNDKQDRLAGVMLGRGWTPEAVRHHPAAGGDALTRD